MKINTINYFIVDALKSIKRNITISFAAMLTVSSNIFCIRYIYISWFKF